MSCDLSGFAALLSIAHHIPGRVRLKLSGAPPAGGGMDVQAVIATLSAIDGVLTVSVNPLARSCTIEYDAKRIAARAWSDLLAGTPSPEAEALMAKIDQAWPLSHPV